MNEFEEQSQETFDEGIADLRRKGRVSPESREVLSKAIMDTLEEDDQEYLANYVGQEVTIYRDLTGAIVGIVTDDD